MARLLLSFLNNLVEGIDKINFKYERKNKKCETYGIKYNHCDCFLEYTNYEHDLIEYKRLCCNKNIQKCLMKS